MKPTDIMYALAKRTGDLERRVETLEKQAMFKASTPKTDLQLTKDALANKEALVKFVVEAIKPKRGTPPKSG